jgi:monovalent cation/hydrogen antiporter
MASYDTTLNQIELVLGLLVAIAVIATLARKVDISYPIPLVVGGLVLGFVPGVPRVELEPDVVFLLFLPPIVFAAAYFTSIRDFRASIGPILRLAVGLVLFTACAVAVVAHALAPELGWGAAFTLGAILAPSDAVATTAIAQRLGVPRRVVTLLEGESMVNDATALVLYQVAVAAVVSGTFSLGRSGVQFVLVAVGGVAIGLVVGWLLVQLWFRITDPTIEVLLSLLAPFAAYLPAELAGVSGVLAVLVAGLYAGRRAARALNSPSRVQGQAVWSMLLFAINGLAFVLIGLEVSAVIRGPMSAEAGQLLMLGAAVTLAVVLARVVWMIPSVYLARLFGRGVGDEGEALPPWKHALVVGWAGMRGVVSLAAALAVPAIAADGSPFPGRDLLIFLTFCVILATLLGQGLTLPGLIRRLGIGGDGGADQEELQARSVALQAALGRIDELADEWPSHRPLIDALRAQYDHRASHLGESPDGVVAEPGAAEQELIEHRAIRRAVIDAQRDAVIGLRDRAEISDEVLRRVERELDLEELRMEA